MTVVVRTHRAHVHTSLQHAFDYVSDLTRHPEWSGGELKVREVAPGPIAVGKKYVSQGSVAVQKDRLNIVRISEYEPPHTFGFIAHDPDFGEVSHVFLFKEENAGVWIERVMTFSLNPILAFLLRFFIYPLVGRPSMDKSLTNLKKKLENQ
jgi:hypothetical protein